MRFAVPVTHVDQPGQLDIAALRAAATVPAAPPIPVRRAGSAGVPVRWGAAVLLPALVLAALGFGLWWAGAGDRAQPPATGKMAWAETLTELDARRSLAFAAGDARMFDGVYAPGSPALTTDVERLGQLRAAGVTPRGLRLTVLGANVLATAPGRVVLAVRDIIRPYQLVNAAGEAVAQRAGRGERNWLITLVPAAAPLGEWRIESIAAA